MPGTLVGRLVVRMVPTGVSLGVSILFNYRTQSTADELLNVGDWLTKFVIGSSVVYTCACCMSAGLCENTWVFLLRN